MSAEGAPRSVPALRASGLWGKWGSPSSRTGLLTVGPSDLRACWRLKVNQYPDGPVA